MKKIFTLLAAAAVGMCAWAQEIQVANAKAVLCNSANEVISNVETTMDIYEDGTHQLNDFLGSGYQLADLVFILTDDNVQLTEYEEAYGYKYIDIYDNAAEEYIQPYVYDIDCPYGSTYSSYDPEGKTDQDGVEWERYAYVTMYDTAFGGYAYLDIYWNLPVVEEEGTDYEAVAVIFDMMGTGVMINPITITVYDNGSIYVQNFMGEGYTGASFYFEAVDEEIIFLNGFEYTEYGLAYLNIWDEANQSYIQPYFYDSDSGWGDYSTFYTGVKHEADGKVWGTHACIFMYSEDLFPADAWYYGYLDLYWDCQGTVGISSVAAETENAPVEYYNLNGVRVENPSNGIYIVKQGSKVTKQVIR
ncbi:MAG: hypothetical protein LIP09_10690 [Bacteroidales bacterium]|nr:hypothetical protein [Bacteroidales bacterium]